MFSDSTEDDDVNDDDTVASSSSSHGSHDAVQFTVDRGQRDRAYFTHLDHTRNCSD